jgi:hypothetical protein
MASGVISVSTDLHVRKSYPAAPYATHEIVDQKGQYDSEVNEV